MNEPEFEYETADGKLYIRIVSAERKTFRRWDGEVSLPAEEIRGRVQISTDPKWEANTDLGFVKVRGRKYGIEHYVQRLSDDSQNHRGDPWLWNRESSYSGGYRNDMGRQVSYDAKAHDSLRDIEDEVLGRFEKEHPDWQVTSARKLFEYERDWQLREAERQRKDADAAERKAAEWQARIDELG